LREEQEEHLLLGLVLALGLVRRLLVLVLPLLQKV
jgi:hypothetical protein